MLDLFRKDYVWSFAAGFAVVAALMSQTVPGLGL